MQQQAKILGIIPARGGSKGLPRKNVLPLADKPMIAWTIEAALHSGVLAQVIVTTDDAEIAGVAQQWGAAVPFMRPPELASDTATSIDVVLHTLEWVIRNAFMPDYVFLLQPTSPLRTLTHVQGAAALALAKNADAVIGVCEATSHPYLTHRISETGALSPFIDITGRSLRRQDLPDAYVINGAAYVVKPSVLQQEQTLFPSGRSYPYVMEARDSIDVDTHWDFQLAEIILRDRQRRAAQA